jgi:peroxiredoxin
VQALSDLAALDKALAATPPKPPEAPSETVAELTLNADELALLTRIQPIHVAPSYWTVKEEENAQDVVELYTTGKVTRVRSTYREYNTDVDPSFPDRRPDLVGKALPQTRFIGPDGRVVDLERFKGNPVLVVILRGFAGQICLYCSQQTRVLTEFRPKFLEKKCEIVFVYPGPAAAVPVFLDAIDSLGGLQGEPPILALDVDLRLVRDLGIEKQLAQPTSIILDTEGKVGYTYVGENMVDRPSAIWLLEQLGKLRR